MYISRERAKQLHRELWHWLMMNPRKSKYSWPRWKHNGGPISLARNECFACSINEYYEPDMDLCEFCPCLWPENAFGDTRCDGQGGLFIKWRDHSSIGSLAMERSKLAKQIKETWL